MDIAELRLCLIALAVKPAHRHLSPADLDLVYGLAKQITRSKNAKEYFEYNLSFGISYWRRRSALFFGMCSKG